MQNDVFMWLLEHWLYLYLFQIIWIFAFKSLNNQHVKLDLRVLSLNIVNQENNKASSNFNKIFLMKCDVTMPSYILLSNQFLRDIGFAVSLCQIWDGERWVYLSNEATRKCRHRVFYMSKLYWTQLSTLLFRDPLIHS